MSAKVFLGMSAALVITGLIIYVIVMVSIPQRYQVMLDERLSKIWKHSLQPCPLIPWKRPTLLSMNSVLRIRP